MAVVVKHLAREFDLSPFAIREILREHFVHKPHKRWSWEPNDGELKEVKAKIRDIIHTRANGNGAGKAVPQRAKNARKA